MSADRQAEDREVQRLHEVEVARIEQSNDISGIVQDVAMESGRWIGLHDRFAIADALYAAGYRLTRVEHVHAAPYSAQPSGLMDFDAIERIVRSSPATHRRRVYSGPWEPMPDGETAPADGITYTQDGQP
ncbi:hypothetical protein SEA_PULCHRA_90 [Microbacterium phage Pulchra]|uniref:Uncharacterized protein n=3 Tax=Caudoviricetes TaxID=2731619 RepID=A0A8F3ECZ7_9CAUD|nr:hypothetical protein SEA_PULCHRA_90 [Microbacterium phage Pulchra]QWY84870.1 hypothetical protein SEA_SELWYN23_90 [Microbacterium phage Selwyn23]